MTKTILLLTVALLQVTRVGAEPLTDIQKELMFSIMAAPTLAYTCDYDNNPTPPVYMNRVIKAALNLTTEELENIMESPKIIKEFTEYSMVYSVNGETLSKKYCDLAKFQAERWKALDPKNN